MNDYKLILKNAENLMLKYKHAYVGSEHLIMALLSNNQFANKIKITFKEFELKLIDIVGRGKTKSEVVLYTPLLKQILEEVNKELYGMKLYNHIFEKLIESQDGIGLRLLDTVLTEQNRSINEFLTKANIENITDKYPCLVDLKQKVIDKKTKIFEMESELNQILKNLIKIRKPNIILTGKAGIGKTALVEKLAIYLNSESENKMLQDYELYQLDMSLALSGTKYRGEFEERITEIVDWIIKQENIILFIDEIHNTICSGNDRSGSISAAEIFKPALGRGEIKVIGATTDDEFERLIEFDSAYKRRFNRISIEEPNATTTARIMEGWRDIFENKYQIKINNRVLRDLYQEALKIEGHMPDKALDLLENYCIEQIYEEV